MLAKLNTTELVMSLLIFAQVIIKRRINPQRKKMYYEYLREHNPFIKLSRNYMIIEKKIG